MVDRTSDSSRKTFLELMDEKKAEFNRQFDDAGAQAKAAREGGKLHLVNEFIMVPHRGHGFAVRKG